MTRILMVAVAALLSGTAIASAQTATGIAPAPADPSSTTSDTRKIDQATAPPAGPSTMGGPGPATTGTTTGTTSPPTTEHWRSSSGLNNDPTNPSGAPK